MFVQTLRKPCQNVPCLLGMTFWSFFEVCNWYFIYGFTSFLLLAQQIQMLHILCGTDVLSQRMMENMFVSQAGVSNIVFYTSTANDTTQQEWLYWTLGVLYFTLFYCVFRERGSTQCCHPAPHTFICTQQPYRQRCSNVKVGTSTLLVSLKWFCCSWNQEKYLRRKPVQLFSCVNK